MTQEALECRERLLEAITELSKQNPNFRIEGGESLQCRDTE